MAIATEVQASPLAVDGLTSGYGDSVVVHDVRMELEAGQIACLMGRNGVGKTTLLKTIVGLIRARAGTVLVGSIDLSHAPAHTRARAGLGYVPQGRGIFSRLAADEQVLLHGQMRKDASALGHVAEASFRI